MRTRPLGPVGARARTMPPEIVQFLVLIAALLAVVGLGAAISAALPQAASPWLVASSYAAPAAIAFAVYWWIAQRT